MKKEKDAIKSVFRIFLSMGYKRTIVRIYFGCQNHFQQEKL